MNHSTRPAQVSLDFVNDFQLYFLLPDKIKCIDAIFCNGRSQRNVVVRHELDVVFSLGIYPGPVIFYGAFNVITATFEIYSNLTHTVLKGRYAVLDRILHIRLHDHRRYAHTFGLQVWRYMNIVLHTFTESQLFKIQVEGKYLYFLTQNYGRGRAVV